MSHQPRTRTRARRVVWCLGLVALLTVGAVACRPAPQNWHYNTVRQAHSTATFGVHHVVEYRYNGRRIETLSNKCAADNWYSGLRYTGYCTAKARHGRLEVEWGWVWVKGSPPIARSQSYVCAYNVSVNGKITRLKTGLLDLPCSKFQP